MDEYFEASLAPLIKDFARLPNKDGLDHDGDIIFYGDKIYRGITPLGANTLLQCFDTGTICELYNRRLIPKTTIASFELPGYSFLLEHEKIKNVSYAFEWSFSMIRDAALMVLDVFELLSSHGFGLKDGHPYNILFNKNRPVWVDITSFIESQPNNFWAITEFFYTILQPLELISKNPVLARERLKNNIYMPFQVDVYLNLAIKFGLKKQHRFPALLRRYEKLFANYIAKGDLSKGIEIMRKKINELNLVPGHSMWSEYQDNWIDADKNVIVSGDRIRFLKIANIISSLPIKSVVEFGANQGMFPAILAENSNIEKIVAIDDDEYAVDTMYNLLSKKRLSDNCVNKIFPMVGNFCGNIYPHVINFESLFDRTKCDAVVALALTHHLLLSQRVKIENMFQRFSLFTNRFIFIEFMPLGLYEGIHQPPPTPSWYTEEYFTKTMEKFFRILIRIQLEKNRILFVGELISGAQKN